MSLAWRSVAGDPPVRGQQVEVVRSQAHPPPETPAIDSWVWNATFMYPANPHEVWWRPKQS